MRHEIHRKGRGIGFVVRNRIITWTKLLARQDIFTDDNVERTPLTGFTSSHFANGLVCQFISSKETLKR